MPAEPCKERRELSRAVANAIEALYRAKEAYEDAAKGAKDKTELQAAVNLAREVEVMAVENLRAHVDAHGCKV